MDVIIQNTEGVDR